MNLKKVNESNMKNNISFTDGINDNWYELRFGKIGPDRRSYHASFIHNKKYLTLLIIYSLDSIFMVAMILEKVQRTHYIC